MILVREIMSENMTPLNEEMSLPQAVDHLLASNMLGLPVTDGKKHVTGFLSEQDCIPYLLGDSYHCDSHVLVKDMMRRDPLIVKPTNTALELAQMMAINKPKIYPVVENGILVGVVKRGQVMAALNQQLKRCRVA
ncbi:MULTISPECIES: CBS domain-containing protein [Amphritea]|uniref:CBS domain-containing protein n=2 Tax=Amphritea TaxID=515417 RepID=A0A1H9K338_9GAMM|nr:MULTISPECIES: CBS domain-containing protein [Amphritea]MBN0988071.1 CBS domain-containing protein [Amphritea pacifica]MBN1006716.1 CBS domain-containing protein [Amphritea pacifica]SEQ93490.1 CBS domain-containing protein [Amphritea atlantica]